MNGGWRAFTVKPFWALLIMSGAKDVENRSWRCRPGRYMVHASRSMSYAEHREAAEWVRTHVPGAEVPTLEACMTVAGKILGSVAVEGAYTQSKSAWWDGEGVAWALEEPRRYEPVAAVGRLGMWAVDRETVAMCIEGRARIVAAGK